MNRTSLWAELTELRRRYTGERRTVAVEAIRDAIDVVDVDTRLELATVLRGRREAGGTSCFVGGAAGTVHLQSIAQKLLPDAGSLAQRVLEAAVMSAASRAAEALRVYPPMSLMRPVHVIESVEPRPAGALVPLRIRLSGSRALGPLLENLLPVEVDPTIGEVGGLAGVRLSATASTIRLHLLGTEACVEVADVQAAEQRAAFAYLDTGYRRLGDRTWTSAILWRHFPSTLTPVEKMERQLYPDRPDAVTTPSMLLRRIRLISAGSTSLRGWQSAANLWKFEWAGHLDPAQVANHLVHPLFGLPGWQSPTDSGMDAVEITGPPARNDMGAARFERSRLILLRDDHLPLDRSDIVDLYRGKVLPEWTAWRESIGAKCRPRPVSPVERRRAFTGESVRLARTGHGSTGDELDRCDDAQLRLRALLALHLFNHGRSVEDLFADSGVATITAYELAISPRLDELVIATDAPKNAVGYIVWRGHGRGIPGMRIDNGSDSRVYRLRHLPSGASVTVVGEGDGDSASSGTRPLSARWPRTDIKVSDEELKLLRRTPRMSHDVERLLAAVMVRISTRDPHGLWALGTWFDDPLGRPRAGSGQRVTKARRLAGDHDEWRLEWTDFPFAFDVAASLVAPGIGLSGAKAIQSRTGLEIRYDAARLILNGPERGPSVGVGNV